MPNLNYTKGVSSSRNMTSKDVELLMSQRRDRRNSHVAFRLIPLSNALVDEVDIVTDYDVNPKLSLSSGSVKDYSSIKGGRLLRSVYASSLIDDAFCKFSKLITQDPNSIMAYYLY